MGGKAVGGVGGRVGECGVGECGVGGWVTPLPRPAAPVAVWREGEGVCVGCGGVAGGCAAVQVTSILSPAALSLTTHLEIRVLLFCESDCVARRFFLIF
jgi:hypothetical protein